MNTAQTNLVTLATFSAAYVLAWDELRGEAMSKLVAKYGIGAALGTIARTGALGVIKECDSNCAAAYAEWTELGNMAIVDLAKADVAAALNALNA